VVTGPVVTIRRKLRDWTMQEYAALGAVSAQAAEFLEACVKAKVNLVISGGTSTGKTTLVSILSSLIPPGDRVITIENVSELELQGRQHWVRLVGSIRPLSVQVYTIDRAPADPGIQKVPRERLEAIAQRLTARTGIPADVFE